MNTPQQDILPSLVWTIWEIVPKAVLPVFTPPRAAIEPIIEKNNAASVCIGTLFRIPARAAAPLKVFSADCPPR